MSPQATAPHLAQDYERMMSNYKLFNNIIDQKDLERECNPLGLEIGQFKDLVQPYNKTYNKIQTLLGDELRRPFNYKAVLVDGDSVRSKIEVRDSMIKNYIYKQIQDTISAISSMYTPQLVDQMVEEILPPEEINKRMKYTYMDRREILSNKILNFLERYLSIRDLKNDAYKHALITGKEFVYVGHNDTEPVLTVLNPLGVFYHKSNETKWVQDGLYAGYRTYMTIGDVLDRYGKYLSKEDIDKLENNTTILGVLPDYKLTSDMQYHRDEEDNIMGHVLGHRESSYERPRFSNILVQHVEWKSQKKVGFLSTINEYGDVQTSIVSEDFVVPDSATTETVEEAYGVKTKYQIWEEEGVPFKITWDFIPEIWSGVRIGPNIYCMVGPKEQQFRALDNPHDVKLGYHGLIYSAMNADPIALMDRMKPFQYLYFIVMHKLKKLIAQDQGKVFHFDASMVDPKLGLEKTLYYIKELNIDIYNPLMNSDTIGQAQRSGKISHSTDMSNMQNILNYIGILNAIDQQISDVAGIARGREGQLGAGEAVTNAQSNIQMSEVVTEIYNQGHNKLWEKVLTSLVSAARYAWRDKDVIKQFVLDDLSVATLEFSKEDPLDYEIGVFITDSGKEHEMFRTLRQMADGLLNTNRATFSDLIKLYEATSLSQLKAGIEESEEKMQQQSLQSQQMQQQADAASLKAQQDFELLMQQRQHEHELLLHELDAARVDADTNDNNVPDALEIEKFKTEAALKARKLDLEEAKLKQDKELRQKEIAARGAAKKS